MMYLDAAATTPVQRDVLQAMWPFLSADFGNPSSHHELGESAENALGRARKDVAKTLNCRAREIVFTSGGTESDNAAIKGIALAEPRGKHIITSAIEHPAVLESTGFLARLGFEVTVLEVDGEGLIDPNSLQGALREDTTLVSIQYANNEVGTVQPIAELALRAAEANVLFHTDAVQAGPWLDLDVERLGVRAMSLSGHKVGGPKGVGVLYVRRGVPIEPLIHGGGQEAGRRSGTENVAGAVGMAAALATSRTDVAPVIEMRDRFIDEVLSTVPAARLTGSPIHRLPGTASFVFPGTSGEAILVQLGAAGIICSSGSACAAGSDEPSHVLIAMGIDRAEAQTAVRFTFGPQMSQSQLDEAAHEVARAVETVNFLSR